MFESITQETHDLPLGMYLSFYTILKVFVKDSVNRSLRELIHESGARVLSAEGARSRRRRKMSAVSMVSLLMQAQEVLLLVLHHEGAHIKIKS